MNPSRVRLTAFSAVVLFGLLLQLTSHAAWAYPSPGRTERVSVPPAGGQGDGFSTSAVISADGRYTAFVSSSRNLVTPSTNGHLQIFVRDEQTGAIDLVSVRADGAEAHLGAESPAISADGRYVAFTSFSRLAPGSIGPNNVYVRDRVTKTTELITVPATEGKSSFGASSPTISADGRYVAFYSNRTDLVAGIPESSVPPNHVYVRDRVDGRTEVASVASDGTPGNGSSFYGTLDPTGRYVAFYSFADDLVPGDTNAGVDVFVHDREDGTTERVSVAHDGSQSNGDLEIGAPMAFSAGGRFLAFMSSATDLVPRDSNGSADIFVRDREANTTERVSVTAAGKEAEYPPPDPTAGPQPPPSHGPTISADGRFVGFATDAENLGGGPSDQVFVYDRLLGSTELVSRTEDGQPSEQASGSISLDGDGSTLVFVTAGANLVPKDTNGAEDVFKRERGGDLGVVELVAERSETGSAGSGSARFAGLVGSASDDPSDDGGAPATASGAELTGASIAFRPEQEDTYLRLDLASLPRFPRGAAAGLPGVEYRFEMTLDGVPYQVRASLVGPSGSPDFSLYECDIVCERVTTLAGGLGSSGTRITVAIPFEDLPVCCGNTLIDLRVRSAVIASDVKTVVDEIQLADASLGAPRVEIAVAPAGTPPEEAVFAATDALEAGRFTWTAPSPTITDPGAFDVLARACLGSECSPVTTAAIAGPDPSPEPDPTTSVPPAPEDTPEPIPEGAEPRDRTSRLSVADGGGDPNKQSHSPAFSANGRYVAFFSRATNLVPDGQMGIYVADRITGTVEFIAPGFQRPDLSMSGRFVVFGSSAALVEEDRNFTPDVYVYDRKTDKAERVSESSDGGEANFDSYRPTISDNGRFVLFDSIASNLVEGDTNGNGDPWMGEDVFLHDRRTSETTRVSVSATGEQGNAYSQGGAISADASTAVFVSAASNLVPADLNGMTADVFVRDLASGSIELATVSSDETQTSYSSGGVTPPSISADGRYVAFDNPGPELVPADYNFNQDVFVRDRVEGTTERISVTSSGGEADAQSSFRSDLSADGRYVMFDSGADLLSEGPSGFFEFDFNTYSYDRVTGLVERTSVTNAGEEGVESAFEPAVSADGRYVAFQGRASLVPDDSNGFSDIYLRDRGPLVGIGDLTAKFEGGVIDARGWASFSGAEIAQADDGEDATDGISPAGSDLQEAHVAYRPSLDDLMFRLDLYRMPSVPILVAGAPTVVYGWGFTVDDVDYELRATNGHWLTLPVFELYRCSTNPCARVTNLEGGYGSAGHDVRIALPLSEIAAVGGTGLTGVRAFSGLGDTATGALAVSDSVEVGDVIVPKRELAAAVVPGGTTREDVEFDVPIAADDNGTFAFDFDASELAPGAYDVWSRACVGATCGSATRRVSVSGTTQTPLPTYVAFTDASAASGQYSDESLFEARLTDADGTPLADHELTFELAGTEGTRNVSATTNAEGVAAVTETLEDKPGIYQLTVRFPGTDAYEASADTVAFVIAPEDTDLALDVTGKGANRTLTARLADRDSDGGVAGRIIDFYADSELIGSATTDDNGVATLQAPPGYRGGKHDFEARFAGDDVYLSSSAQAQSHSGRPEGAV